MTSNIVIDEQDKDFEINTVEDVLKCLFEIIWIFCLRNDKLDAPALLRVCWIRKELTTGRFMVDISVIPDQFHYCYSLGVVLTH